MGRGGGMRRDCVEVVSDVGKRLGDCGDVL